MDARERTRAPRADAERNRALILEAAAKVFALHGIGATLNAVADEAGVGVGTIYRNYPDKGALLAALHETKVEQMLAIAAEAASLPDPGDGLRRYLRAVFAARAGDRGLAAALMVNADHDGALGRRLGADIERLVDRAREAGQVRRGLSGSDVPLLVAMVGVVADMTADLDGELWRRYADLLIDAIRPDSGPLEGVPPEDGDLPVLFARMG